MVNWNTAMLEVPNMEELDIIYADICKPEALGLQLIPGYWNITVARKLCNNLKGEINLITDKNNQEIVLKLMNKSNM